MGRVATVTPPPPLQTVLYCKARTFRAILNALTASELHPFFKTDLSFFFYGF